MMEEHEFTGITDLHSHLVPGVDDGAATLEESLDAVDRMVERGITSIITTPHLLGSLTRDPEALELRLGEVDDAFRRLVVAVAERYPELRLRRGHEVMLDRPDVEFSDPRVRLAGGRCALVEWPRLQIPPETGPAIRRIREQGVIPVLAHPERYAGYDDRMSLIPIWRAEGAILQVNHASLTGRYGPEPRARALTLLEEGWVDCLSTDFHARPTLRLYLEASKSFFEERDAMESWWLLTRTNPGRIGEGELPLPVPPLRADRGFWARLRTLLRR